MAAPVKSCYNTSVGEFLFEDDPVFSGKEHEAFLKCCEPLSVMRVCVNAAASDSLVAELAAFDKGFRKLKRHLKDDEGAGEIYEEKLLNKAYIPTIWEKIKNNYTLYPKTSKNGIFLNFGRGDQVRF